MLVLSRQLDEWIELWLPDGSTIKVQVTELRGDRVRLGFEADQSVRVYRSEIADAIRRGRVALPDAVKAGLPDYVIPL